MQERLGHASIQHTLDIYSHVTQGLQDAVALKSDEGLKQANMAIPVRISETAVSK